MLSEELRESRLRKLHDEFLSASAAHVNFRSLLITADDSTLDTVLFGEPCKENPATALRKFDEMRIGAIGDSDMSDLEVLLSVGLQLRNSGKIDPSLRKILKYKNGGLFTRKYQCSSLSEYAMRATKMRSTTSDPFVWGDPYSWMIRTDFQRWLVMEVVNLADTWLDASLSFDFSPTLFRGRKALLVHADPNLCLKEFSGIEKEKGYLEIARLLHLLSMTALAELHDVITTPVFPRFQSVFDTSVRVAGSAIWIPEMMNCDQTTCVARDGIRVYRSPLNTFYMSAMAIQRLANAAGQGSSKNKRVGKSGHIKEANAVTQSDEVNRESYTPPAKISTILNWFKNAGIRISRSTLTRKIDNGIYLKMTGSGKANIALLIASLPAEMQSQAFWDQVRCAKVLQRSGNDSTMPT